MLRLLFLAVAGITCVQSATPPSPTEQETLQRIRDLEARLERAEALIRQLMDKQGSPTILESTLDKPAPVAAPEVTRSESAPAVAPQRMPQELLPNLGLIGASASFAAGTHTGSYSTGPGTYFSGSVSLPLARAPRGLWLYEFSAGITRGSAQLKVTSNVAQVANIAVLGPSQINDALNGTGAAPFPVRIDTRSQIDLLQVVPFAIKYQSDALNRWRLRPYAIAGLGLFVTISNQTSTTGLRPNSGLESIFGNGAPFGGSLIGGQLTAARELTALGIPSGQGGISPGFQTGGGIEWRWRPRLSFGVDVRYNRLSTGASFFTIAPRSTFHF